MAFGPEATEAATVVFGPEKQQEAFGWKQINNGLGPSTAKGGSLNKQQKWSVERVAPST